MGSNEPLGPEDAIRRNRLRNRSAGIVKDVLSARLQLDHQNVTDDILRAWWREESRPSKRPAKYLLAAALVKVIKYREDYYGGEFSVGPFDSEDPNDPDFQEQRVSELIQDFIQPEGLREAIESLQLGKPIDWRMLADWRLLTELRDLLNRLSVGPTKPPSRAAAAIDFDVKPPNLFLYQGTPFEGLTPQQSRALACLKQGYNYAVETGRFEDLVWPEDAARSPAAVRKAIGRVNGFFRTHSIPLEVRKNETHVFLKPIEKLTRNSQ